MPMERRTRSDKKAFCAVVIPNNNQQPATQLRWVVNCFSSVGGVSRRMKPQNFSELSMLVLDCAAHGFGDG